MSTLTDEQTAIVVTGFLREHGPAPEETILEVIKAADHLAIQAAMFELLMDGKIVICDVKDDGPVFDRTGK